MQRGIIRVASLSCGNSTQDGLKQQSARMSFYVPSGGVKSAVGSSTTGTATGALDKNKLQQRETEKLKVLYAQVRTVSLIRHDFYIG